MLHLDDEKLACIDLLDSLIVLAQNARKCREARTYQENVDRYLDDLRVPHLSRAAPFLRTDGIGHKIKMESDLIGLQVSIDHLGKMAEEAIGELFKVAWALDEATAGGAGPQHPEPENGRVQNMRDFMTEMYPELLDCIPEPCGPDGGRENVHYFKPVEGSRWYETEEVGSDLIDSDR